MTNVKTITTKEFPAKLKTTPKVVVVALIEEGCDACQRALKALDGISEKEEFEHIELLAMDVKANPDIIEQIGRQITPPVFVAYRGQDPMRTPRRAQAGFVDEQRLASWLGALKFE